jgi:hypothetical protein
VFDSVFRLGFLVIVEIVAINQFLTACSVKQRVAVSDASRCIDAFLWMRCSALGEVVLRF